MIKLFSDYRIKNGIIYITRISNNKEYIIIDLITRNKNILKEWSKDNVAYQQYKSEYIQLKNIYRKIKKEIKNTNIN